MLDTENSFNKKLFLCTCLEWVKHFLFIAIKWVVKRNRKIPLQGFTYTFYFFFWRFSRIHFHFIRFFDKTRDGKRLLNVKRLIDDIRFKNGKHLKNEKRLTNSKRLV